MDFQTRREVELLVEAAGGPSELGRRMGMTRQRIQNWRMAGRIPEMVARAFGPMFKRIMAKAKVTT